MKSSRMLVGCFSNRPYEEGETHWSETKKELLTQQTLDDIIGFKQVITAYRTTEQGFEVWHIDSENDDREFTGLLEVIRKGYASVSHLRGFKSTKAHPTTPEPPLGLRLSESFYQRTVEALKRYFNTVTSPVPVSVQLERVGDVCRVTFTDEDSTILQEVEHESVPDLFSLLRWPIINAGPMYTDVGEYVTWNIFEDIDYSDLEFLRPYIIYRATRTAPEELPSSISQFFETSEELTVEIGHDESVCPLAIGVGEEHTECWYITLPKDAPRKLKQQLEGCMTGRVVHGLLSPGRIWSGRLFELNFTFSHTAGSPECLVFQEEKWIRKLLRSHGVNLPKIPPGLYLRAEEEKWKVNISMTNNAEMSWSATSTLTEKQFSRFAIIAPLDFTNDLEKEQGRILDTIFQRIGVTSEKIYQFSKTKESTTDILESWGFGDTSPPCELSIEHNDSEISFVLKLKDVKDDYEVARATNQVDMNTSRETEEEGFYETLQDGWLSKFSIVNEEESRKKFSEVLVHMGFSDQDGGTRSSLLHLSLYVEDGCIKWMAKNEYGQAIDNGVLLEDAVEWFQTVSIEEFKEILKMNLKGIGGNIRNLNDVLEGEFEDIIDEIKESFFMHRD
ncbi:MAG: hypothetical protein P1Q69_05805 [Candidatus Thorarchaeota archaeon]|nr:hypothetical protein [Candidatus Thorarchaeota archaeon]